MPLSFRKMHGLGNDFVVVDLRPATVPALTPEAARAIADRREGVGCDQVITLEPPRQPEATAFMGIWNPDGSQSGACGNATRCVATLLMAETGGDSVVIETVSGLLPAWRAPEGLITVDMGPPRLGWQDIPLSEPADTAFLDLTEAPLSGQISSLAASVSMGNPHVVFFVPSVSEISLEEFGPRIEHHPLFPQRTNVEIVEILAANALRMRVWERGAGITRACGSGACAVLVAAARRGLSERRAAVHLDGGTLHIEWREADGHVLMTGPVATAFTGDLDESLL